MAVRPRLLAVSLAIALVVGVAGGWVLNRAQSSPTVPDDIVLDTPGEYQQPIEGADQVVTGVPFPSVALLDVTDAEVPSRSLVGAPLVVNVWFSTCPPCARELADFAEVHREVGDRVRFVGINPLDGTEAMQRFAAERGVAYELLRDPASRFLDAAGVASFPRTLFVDEQGIIVGEAGELDADDLRARIEELL
jgi:peroxiredoxin